MNAVGIHATECAGVNRHRRYACAGYRRGIALRIDTVGTQGDVKVSGVQPGVNLRGAGNQ